MDKRQWEFAYETTTKHRLDSGVWVRGDRGVREIECLGERGGVAMASMRRPSKGGKGSMEKR